MFYQVYALLLGALGYTFPFPFSFPSSVREIGHYVTVEINATYSLLAELG